MKHYTEYKGHEKRTWYDKRTKQTYDDTPYSFDIEDTSFVLFDGKVYNASFYDTLSYEEKKRAKCFSYMYIWMFSIDGEVYYGRTWEEHHEFMEKVFFKDKDITHYIYVHNLAHECQFLRGEYEIVEPFARQKYKPIDFYIKNCKFRCSYILTDSALAGLTDIYNLPVEKLVGALDYNLIRHHETEMSEEELKYCENDCLVLHELIKKLTEEHKHIKNIPSTNTGFIRREVKSVKEKKVNGKYTKFKCKVNLDLKDDRFEVYELLRDAFAGGYTHANHFYSGKLLKNVDGHDVCSYYPSIMSFEPVFPQKKFKKLKYTTLETLEDDWVYLMKIKMTNVQSKKMNTIISSSRGLKRGRFVADNGRLISCDEFTTTCTHLDYFAFREFYDFDVELLELWGAPAGYLPYEFRELILKIYKDKTELKNVAGREADYQRSKSRFNSLYGMTVTNNIKEEVLYVNNEWVLEDSLTDKQIADRLKESCSNRNYFLPYAYGIFVTAAARYGLFKLISKLDRWCVYSDTDSLKLLPGYDKTVIEEYNNEVMKKIEKAKETGLDGYTQYDIEGKPHTLGILEFEETYPEFKTLGAKKYCYLGWNKKTKQHEIKITVAGVPKAGAKVLKSVDEFSDNTYFPSSVTGKLQHIYNEERDLCFTLTDYKGKECDIVLSYGVALVPCSYTLSECIENQAFHDMFLRRR